MTEDDVVAITRDWLEKAVIGLNLCPFARSVYIKEQVRYCVSQARHTDGLLEELDTELDLLAAADPEKIDTTLLIIPHLLQDFLDFNDLTALAEASVVEHELEGVLQVASFHPQFQFADTEPDAISNYTNRAPFPIWHLIRESSLARAVAAYPNPEAIYERNIETLERLGQAGWAALGMRQPG
jgi:hypothetical protein